MNKTQQRKNESGYEAKDMEYHAGNYEGKSDYVFKNCIFLQFTGLLDKNGVEIYEGDILKHSYLDDRLKNIEETMFVE